MKKAAFIPLVIWIFFILISYGCQENKIGIPKPHMYPHITFPEKEYVRFDEPYCQLTFAYPSYSEIIQDTLFFDEKPSNDCWFDLVFPDFNGTLHCSYYPINGEGDFEKLIQDAFTFVDKHDIKANYRAETKINGSEGNGGILFEIEGPVASPVQFFITDSVDHFLRGSLYFNNKVQPDSMAAVHKFIAADIFHLVESTKFK